MAKITIIGWYGTETIGDRAILAGIFVILQRNFKTFSVELGSIYPFFSERTLLEDYSFLGKCADNENIDISIVDTQNIKSLDTSIKNCDVLIMGGGPLMGFWSMYMVEYAFAKAKKLGKKTMVLGCGVGPLIKKTYEKSLVNIVRKSDITIFRDALSVKEYQRISNNDKEVVSAIDPAVIAALIFKQNNKDIEKIDCTIACIREFPSEYKIDCSINSEAINQKLQSYIIELQEQSQQQFKLLPMHYFAIGGDDRRFMNQMKFNLANDMIDVQNVPLTLEETFLEFTKASACIGMRFHSVVLQTILNGNNLIFDYTDPNKGKISGFLKSIDAFEHYQNSYVNLQTSNLIPSFQKMPFTVQNNILDGLINKYNDLI